MSKTKLDDRLENALNAFFETEPEPDRFELAYSGQPTAVVSTEPPVSEKADKWLRVAREVLLFGPGTFMLFYITLSVAFFYPTLGLSPWGVLMSAFAAFLTYAGAGSIARLKNLAVPLSVVLSALSVVFASLLIFGRAEASLYFWHSIYLFPLVLIIAKVVQYRVSDDN